MKTRHLTNSEKHWKIKKKGMHMENTVLLGEFTIYNQYPFNIFETFFYNTVYGKQNKYPIQF